MAACGSGANFLPADSVDDLAPAVPALPQAFQPTPQDYQPLGQDFGVADSGYGKPVESEWKPVEQSHQPTGYQPVQQHVVPGPDPFPAGDDCEDCAQLVKTTRQVQIPCTRNTYRQYEVKIPRTVHEKVARNVTYTDFEERDKHVNYTVHRPETRYRDETQQYTVGVTKQKTRMVSVTKKVPKTIYVNVVVQEPQNYTVVEQEPRTKIVKIPYTVQVPEERTKIVKERVPVQKMRTEYDDVCKTVYDTQIRTECRPVTKMITKNLPVYSYKALPVGPCNDCPQPAQKATIRTEYSAPERYDVDGDGRLDENERKLAAAHGELTVEKREVLAPGAPGPQIGDQIAQRTSTYSAPAAYDANNDGVLQADEMADAAADGQLRKEYAQGGENINPDAGDDQAVIAPAKKTRGVRRRRRASGGRKKRSGRSSSRRSSGRRKRRS